MNERIERPLVPVVAAMERTGVHIDPEVLRAQSSGFAKRLQKLEEEIHKLAKHPFNVGSPKQLGEVLFVKLGLKPPGGGRQKKTAGGALSTKESELEKLREEHPIIDEILKYRELSKLIGTYLDTIPVLIDEKSRLHSTFIQAGSATVMEFV